MSERTIDPSKCPAGNSILGHYNDDGSCKCVRIEKEQLVLMELRGGAWAAYQNKTMDSSLLGHLLFLQFGEERTFKTPPPHAPDGKHGPGWKYLYIGNVDTEKGIVAPPPAPEMVEVPCPNCCSVLLNRVPGSVFVSGPAGGGYYDPCDACDGKGKILREKK